MDFERLTAFLAWCTVINAIILALTGVGPLVFPRVCGTSSQQDVRAAGKLCPRALFPLSLAMYKAMIIVFNLAPYLALRII